MEVKATKVINGVEKEATVDIDLGADLEDAVSKYGAEVVFDNYIRSAKITAQAAMRRYLEADLPEGEIKEKMAAFKPGVPMEKVAVNTATALMQKFAGLSKEEQEELILKLQEKLGE